MGALLLKLFPATNFSLIAILLGLPLFGALFNGVWGARVGKAGVRLMTLAVIGASFVVSVLLFVALGQYVDNSQHEHVKLAWTAWQWMHTNGGADGGNVPIDVSFGVDALSAMMMLIITGVGFLIHFYATSYMEGETSGGYARFFAYMNLFIFAMLVLVLANNLPLLFVGWEGVGLCSYLLISFWYDKLPNAAAGKKAFIANRVGDFGMLCAMFLLAHYTGALDWAGIHAGAQQLVNPADAAQIHVWPVGGGEYQGVLHFLQPKHPFTITAATAVGLALLLGATGKSAQIPLYVWLPDAMAGPTPVSALIHAATMVTAGVYLVCRLSFVFVLSPPVMMTVASVGAVTALFAATIALVQNDIKKILAYSTISQLGFMFLGVGVGAFTAGFFHVFTHAFFKACLFLCAGSVIHAMHARVHDDDKAQDIRNMGGLRKYMPWTYRTYFAATLAIAGCPLLSGFFSKDEILYRSFVDHSINPYGQWLSSRHVPVFEPPPWLGTALYGIGIAAATMTAFYMFRSFFVTFWGDFRGWTIGRPSLLAKGEVEGKPHEDLASPGYPPHESPWQMTIPLIFLAALSVFAGFLNVGLAKSPVFHAMDRWLSPLFEEPAVKGAVTLREGAEGLEWPLALGGIAAFVVGSALAYWMYVAQKGAPAKRLAQAVPGLYRLVLDKWRIDELNANWGPQAWVEALADTSASIGEWFVDGVVAKLTAFVVAAAGTILRALQNGVVQLYAAVMVVGLAGVGWFFVAPHAAIAVDASAGDASGDYVVSASPGMGYLYRWDANGDGKPDSDKWSDQASVKVHLEEAQSQNVGLEVTNAFGLRATAKVTLKRAASELAEAGQR